MVNTFAQGSNLVASLPVHNRLVGTTCRIIRELNSGPTVNTFAEGCDFGR